MPLLPFPTPYPDELLFSTLCRFMGRIEFDNPRLHHLLGMRYNDVNPLFPILGTESSVVPLANSPISSTSSPRVTYVLIFGVSIHSAKMTINSFERCGLTHR